jgi:hypothetical protein
MKNNNYIMKTIVIKIILGDQFALKKSWQNQRYKNKMSYLSIKNNMNAYTPF